MNTGTLCRITMERSKAMAPMPTRDTLVAKVDRLFREHYPLTSDTKKSRENRLAYADRVVDALLPGTHPRSCAGKSLQEMVWDELMSVYERLVQGMEAADGRDPGRAEGLAMALAVMQNPYRPNIEIIRQQAATRYEEEYQDD
jgi:hypothetical protein